MSMKIKAMIIPILVILLMLTMTIMSVDDYKHKNIKKDAIQKEKSNQSKIQHSKVKEIKINESKTKITLDNGLTFNDTSDLSKHVDAHDKIGYVKYRDYQATKDGLKKGNIKYKVKNIEK